VFKLSISYNTKIILRAAYMMPPLLHMCKGLARPADDSVLARNILR